MNTSAQNALTKLLSSAEQGKRETLAFTENGFSEYLDYRSVANKDEIHACLANARRYGAITIEWVKHYENIQVKRIRVADTARLASFLGRRPLQEQILDCEALIKPYLKDAPEWVSGLFTGIKDKWQSEQKPYGLTPKNSGELIDIITLISQLEGEGSLELDIRSLSVKLFHDSKRIESIQSKLISIYKEHLDKRNAEPNEVLTEIGLVRHPMPILVKGNVEFTTHEGASISALINPFIGIPPDAISSVNLKDPAYILTIENLSSFNGYTRNIHDQGVIIFTHGFPSKGLVAVYKMILAKLDLSVPVYHWGDVDLGGFRILAKLQEYARKTNHAVLPHLMEPLPSDGANDLSASHIKSLRQIGSINEQADLIVRQILDGNTGKMEQESLIPKRPSSIDRENK